MSRWMLVIVLVLTAQFAWSKNLERGPVRGPSRSLDVANPQDENYVLRNGTIALNITNYGMFGNDGPSQNSALDDPCSGEWAPQFEYPEGSGAQYLFQGAVWFGATIVEDGDTIRRVSVGTDGWQNPSINEFHAGEGPDQGIVGRSNLPSATDCNGNSIYDPASQANIEAIAVYSDTLTDRNFVISDPTDGPHFPLGIKISQTARAWSSPEFARFVILDFTLENIGNHELLDAALGLYLDGDVGIAGQINQHTDDITGSILYESDADRLIGWIADGDGRPGQGGEVTLPHAVGFSGLSITQDTLMVNRPGLYNWWVPNGDLALDFGPSWTDGPDWSVTYGTPEGDAHRLQVLTWGEHDYPQHTLGDQQLSQNDNFSCHPGADHAWRADNLSPDYRNNIANGFDTRFLLSWGQIGNFDYVGSDGICHYRLSPGQAISFSAVLFIGEYFHNPENPQPNPNDLDPSLFSYDGLIETYGRALTLFDANYAYQPPTPALNLHATHASSGEVPLNWDAPQVGSIAGYRVFGKPDSGNGERVEFTTELLTAEEYTIAGRTNGDVWLMEVQTEDLAGNHSAYASSLVRVGAIPMNSVLTGSSEQGINTLNWTGVGDPTLTHYKVVRLDSTDEVVFDNLSGLSLVDDNIVSGRVYTYTLFVQNDLGIESLPSNQISLTPFAPSQTILVYDDTRRPSQTELNNGGVSDSLVRLWYQQRLGALGEGFEYVDLTISEAPITLQTLAAYSIVIWHSENQNTGRSPSQIAQREASLREYIQIGGKLIRFGRASLQAMGLSPYSLYPPNGSEVLDPLTLDSFWVSRVQPNPDVSKNLKAIGAAPLNSNFPALTWDANKVEALRFGSITDLEYLPGVDLFWRNGNTWPLYSVNLHEEDSISFDNTAPCAVIGPGEIFFGFPLYFLPEEQAQELLAASIQSIRTQILETPEPPIEPLPTAYALKQNYPNPFNANTVIEFELPVTRTGALRIYNIRGQLVSTLADGTLNAGYHRVSFDAAGLASGLYFYRLEVGSESMTKKLLLLK